VPKKLTKLFYNLHRFIFSALHIPCRTARQKAVLYKSDIPYVDAAAAADISAMTTTSSIRCKSQRKSRVSETAAKRTNVASGANGQHWSLNSPVGVCVCLSMFLSQVKSSLFVQQRVQAAVIINAMLNRND